MATPLVESDEYTYAGLARILWSTAIADVNAVTSQELTDAVDLSCEINNVIGWEINSEIITDPAWGIFDVQRQGRMSVAQAQLLMYADRAGSDIRTLLSRGATGWILILPSGEVAGHPMNVYPVTVAAVPQPITTDGAAMLLVTFAVTSAPGENVAVPTP